jgi:hypothetical protein
LKSYPGPGESKLTVYFWNLIIDPETVADTFTKITLFSIKCSIYKKNRPQSQGQ